MPSSSPAPDELDEKEIVLPDGVEEDVANVNDDELFKIRQEGVPAGGEYNPNGTIHTGVPADQAHDGTNSGRQATLGVENGVQPATGDSGGRVGNNRRNGNSRRPILEWISPNNNGNNNNNGRNNNNHGPDGNNHYDPHNNDNNSVLTTSVDSNTGGPLPHANLVPMDEIVVTDGGDGLGHYGEEDERSAYSGHLVYDAFRFRRKEPVWASVPWLTYGRLLVIVFLVMVVSVGSLLIAMLKPDEVKTVQVTNAPEFSDVATDSPASVGSGGTVGDNINAGSSTSSPSVAPPPSSVAPTGLVAWNPLGDQAIEGRAVDEKLGRSVAVSGDGTRLAAGGNGVLRIYELIAPPTTVKDMWVLVADLSSFLDGDIFGLAMSSDGNFLIAGDQHHKSNTGLALVFQSNTLETGAWELKGNPISGRDPGDMVGASVAVTDDGNVIAVGASGFIKIFDWFGNDWSILNTVFGVYIDSQFGWSVAMSGTGDKVVVGAIQAVNVRDEIVPASVSIYERTDGVITLFQRIDGAGYTDFFGASVAVSNDGTVVAVGADAGDYVKVFALNNTSSEYVQVGDVIENIMGSYFGTSVALSQDGSRLAVGARQHFENHGKTFIYSIDTSVSNSADVDGKKLIGQKQGQAEDDWSGSSVDISGDGKMLAIGAFKNSGSSFEDSGHVRVFKSVGI